MASLAERVPIRADTRRLVRTVLERAGREIQAEVTPEGAGYAVTLDGHARRIEGSFGRSMRVCVDGRPVVGSARREGLDIVVEIGGHAYSFRVRDARAPKLVRRRAGPDLARGELHAPMPGLVVDLLAEVGERVEAGRPIVIVEAMKMQNALTAPVSGRIAAIPVTRGAAVETGQLLVAITPEEA